MDDDNLFDMSDEELEVAYKEAVAQQNSPETELENSSEKQEEKTTEEEDLETVEDNLEEESETESDSSEESTEEAEEEDGSEEKTEDPEEDSEETEEDDSEDVTEEEDEEQTTQPLKFKANGKDYEFTSEEIVDKFPQIFGQAMDYTKKMQAIKPWRKTIDALESEKLNHEDVSLMIDVLKGDKSAISEVIKRTGIDTLELDSEEESKYVAKNYGRDEKTLAVNEVVKDIEKDVEYSTTTSVLNQWDDSSWSVISDNPEMIKLLHADVKSGTYNKLQPIAEKLKVFDGAKSSDLEYYKKAAEQYFAQTAKAEEKENALKLQQEENEAKAKQDRIAKAKQSSKKRDATKEASAKRKAAVPTKNLTNSSSGVIDYLEASDEDFDEWYKSLET